jgi:hypothetical protein
VTKLSIPNVGELIARCWTNAEEALRELVKTKYRDRDEEKITDLFQAELEGKLNQASQNGLVALAFLRDLRRAFPAISEWSLSSNVSRGLVATVSFHAREVEKKTGGDLGVVIVRPDVQWTGYWLSKKNDYKRGLLCQAKIFQRNSRWRPIGAKQARALGGKLSYLSLLLYRYSDQDGQRRELAPFAWQLGRGATIRRINSWLASDDFPGSLNSYQILQRLASDQIGTDDPKVIARDITPPQRPSLIIEVRWQDPYDPGDRIYVRQDSEETHQQQNVVIARG